MFLFTGFTSIPTLVGFVPSRNYRFACILAAYTEIEVDRFGIVIAVFTLLSNDGSK